MMTLENKAMELDYKNQGAMELVIGSSRKPLSIYFDRHHAVDDLDRRITSLKNLEVGWRHGTGEKISARAIETALRVNYCARRLGISSAEVSPLETGGIQLDLFISKALELELDIRDEKHIDIEVTSRDGVFHIQEGLSLDEVCNSIKRAKDLSWNILGYSTPENIVRLKVFGSEELSSKMGRAYQFSMPTVQ